MDLTLQLKDTDLSLELKNKIQLLVDFKKPLRRQRCAQTKSRGMNDGSSSKHAVEPFPPN